MAEEKSVDTGLTKAWVFFDRARKIAETDNFDYAIDMYLEGLRCAPDQLQDGHLKLYALALHRQAQDGKKPSVLEKIKLIKGKTPLDKMINAEYLFAKDPANLHYAGAMLKATIAGEYYKTSKWVADLIFQANNSAKKPSIGTYILLKDSYFQMKQFDRALAACQYAAKLKPSDGELADEVKRLSAELTVARGKYDQGGGFRDSIKNRQAQDELQSQARVIKTEDYRISAVEQARKNLDQDPELSKNIFDLAQVLSELQSDKTDNEALAILENAYKTKSDFSFMQRAGQIRIKQFKRKIRSEQTALEANPGDAQAKAKLKEFTTEFNRIELEHYCLCVENYPTDLQVKYEYGLRLIRNKKYDDAIPMFQETQRDPRHKVSATSKIGLCFFNKGWFVDAIDIFNQALELHGTDDDGVAKDLRYNLARSYQKQGDAEKALEVYRKLAQLDFGYKDVRLQINKLREAKN